ncbi:MAG: PD-(D/E)XK nuclease family protein [Treponema sp.]|uniref:PD-(D/E)XK nuclease family protein n=1 Tax=Treponema sp. TaxID=166 RepID=UPI0025EE8807|nr:PD-(D/E)XK nuclease family protein [Treponema sp.]MBQ8678821.1 PD-(D/E)XK nuclease family protein [Treponema sp.]
MQSVQKLLKEQITNQNSVFVFPTDVACQKWADWAIKNTDCKAVAMERFLAWDKFKGECIRAKAENLRTVPSLMRKIFAAHLIEKNAKEHFFKNLINQKYAAEASSFADWISSMLPSLQMWKNLRDRQADELSSAGEISFDDENLKSFYEKYRAASFTDDEDRDFQILYEEYSRFLSEHSLFDPAWVEPDFSGDGRDYYLICPETLEDWEQYRFKLSGIESLHFVGVPESEGEYESYFFENSGQEVRDVTLFLREMHDEKGIEWSDMAVNVPNMDNFGSYLDRSFSLYEIPHTMRYSRPLSSYGAGAFFAQIQECVENQFSYESLKNLLLNEDIPWENKGTIDNLLLFGRMNNCICTAGPLAFEKGKAVTVWDEAFKNPKDDKGKAVNKDELIRNLYRNLVDLILPIAQAKTFAQIRSAYEAFREMFFDMEAFQNLPLSNNVLSRCISSLNEIVDLEGDFPDYSVDSPFSFFVSHLSSVQYLAQGENRAVQVYPYRSAALAPYKVQVVLDATQDSLSMADSFKPLDFMNENKRRIFMKMGELDSSLGFSESDPSFDFVKLYQHSAQEKAYFTASRHAYNGEYGFVYGKMSRTDEKLQPKKRRDDFAEEKIRLLKAVSLSDIPSKIYARQATGLTAWKKAHSLDKKDSGLFEKNEKLTALIQKRLSYLKRDSIKVTQTTLKNYFKCPRRWLFKNLLRLDPPDNEALLIDEFITGTVNHKILELFFASLKSKKWLLAASENDETELGSEYRKLLVSVINEAVDSEGKNSAFKEIYGESGEKLTASPTTIRVISSQYKIESEEMADQNGNFRILEKAIAKICSTFRGFSVYAVEKNVQALGKDEDGCEMSGYYFDGKIDCILASPNQKEFVIIDYKTSKSPSNLKVKEQEEGKAENIIDFQMPMYVYLLENNDNESERVKVSAATFCSIKEAKLKFFLGGENYNVSKRSLISAEEANLAQKEFLKYAKRFYEEVTEEKFAVNALNQSRAVCAKKDNYDNCIDYQALCRRYFTVSGEQDLK